MDAEQALCLTLGVAIAILGVTLLVRVRPGPERTVFAVSYALVGVFFALWPPQTCLLLDHATGIAGFGLLLWACATTVALGLQVTFHHQIRDRRSWWVRATPALAALIVAVYAAAWMLARLTFGPATGRLLYDGYHGERPAVLMWNLMLGLSIACVSGLAAREQLEDRAAYSLILGSIYVAGVVYGLLIAAQAMASHLGYGAGTVVPVLRAMRLVAMILATGCAVWSVIGSDLWALGRLWLQTRRLRQQWDQLTFLLVVLSDRLVWRHAPEAGNPLAQLARRCARRDRTSRSPSREVLIALQAARRITWRRGALIDGAWDAAPPEDRALAERSIAAEAAHDIATGSAPVSDIGQVVRLILADVELPAGLTDTLPTPEAAHIAAAALLAPYFGASSRVPPASEGETLRPVQIRRDTGLPLAPPDERVGWWTRATYQDLAARHAQAQVDLMVSCELIEDYLLQVDAPDDDDLAIHTWMLGEAQHLSPFQVEIAQRAAQILSLFGPYPVTNRPSARVVLPRWVPWGRTHRAHRPLSETKVTLWCAIAAVIETVLDPARVPVDAAMSRDRSVRDGDTVARLVRQAAQSVRAGERL